MGEVITVGLDLAKNVFQVHGVDAAGQVAFRGQLRRGQVLGFFRSLPPCLVGLEACATSHHWAREIGKLGHSVRMMPAKYVKAYVKRNKNDAADAEAICEAVTRPTMRFVSVKTVEQQSVLLLHRTRELLVRQRTMLVNAIRAHMAEFGIVARAGRPQVKELLSIIGDGTDERLSTVARSCLTRLAQQIVSIEREISMSEQQILAWHRCNETSRRLETIPGIGPITASALTSSIADPSIFRSGRQMAAWLGLVPRQSSTGGKERLGRISKQGDTYLRWLLIAGAMAVIRQARRHGAKSPWLAEVMARRPTKVAAAALANKNARIAWAVLSRGETYRPQHVAAP
jgi:transposase